VRYTLKWEEGRSADDPRLARGHADATASSSTADRRRRASAGSGATPGRPAARPWSARPRAAAKWPPGRSLGAISC